MALAFKSTTASVDSSLSGGCGASSGVSCAASDLILDDFSLPLGDFDQLLVPLLELNEACLEDLFIF